MTAEIQRWLVLFGVSVATFLASVAWMIVTPAFSRSRPGPSLGLSVQRNRDQPEHAERYRRPDEDKHYVA